MDLLITASVNIYLIKESSNSNENMIFLRKRDEKIWKPPFLREPSTSEQFFHDPFFVQISKMRTLPPPPNFRGW